MGVWKVIYKNAFICIHLKVVLLHILMLTCIQKFSFKCSFLIYFIISIILNLIFQNSLYFCSLLIVSFWSCHVYFYLLSSLWKIIVLFLLSKIINFMFAVNRKSLGEFLKRKVNLFYLAQFSISTLPENVRKRKVFWSFQRM